MEDEIYEELVHLDLEIDCLYRRIHELDAELKKQKELTEYWKNEYHEKQKSEQVYFGES